LLKALYFSEETELLSYDPLNICSDSFTSSHFKTDDPCCLQISATSKKFRDAR